MRLYCGFMSRSLVKIRYLPSVEKVGLPLLYQRSVTGYSLPLSSERRYTMLISLAAGRV